MKTKNLRYRVCTFFILCLGIASPQHTYGGNFEEAANSWQEKIKEQKRNVKELKEKTQIKKKKIKAWQEENEQLGDATTSQVLDELLQETLAEEKKLNDLEQELNETEKEVIEKVALGKRLNEEIKKLDEEIKKLDEDIKRIDEKNSREIILSFKAAAVVAAGVVLFIAWDISRTKSVVKKEFKNESEHDHGLSFRGPAV